MSLHVFSNTNKGNKSKLTTEEDLDELYGTLPRYEWDQYEKSPYDAGEPETEESDNN